MERGWNVDGPWCVHPGVHVSGNCNFLLNDMYLTLFKHLNSQTEHYTKSFNVSLTLLGVVLLLTL